MKKGKKKIAYKGLICICCGSVLFNTGTAWVCPKEMYKNGQIVYTLNSPIMFKF